MNYDIAAKELRGKLENLQRTNTQLRDELAVVLNENYIYASKDALRMTTINEQNQIISAQQSQIDSKSVHAGELESQLHECLQELAACQQELVFIKNSNSYKVWMRYRRLPEPIRNGMRGFFGIFKRIYRGVKKVFS